MQRQIAALLLAITVPLFAACQQSADTGTPVVETLRAGRLEETQRAQAIENDALEARSAKSIRVQVAATNSRDWSEPDFSAGHVTPRTQDDVKVTPTDSGFVVEFPSQSPIPTPTIWQGRLYVSGGFSSQEYYCLDVRSGEIIWSVELDDDGPSSAVPFEDSIILGCESCTLFALSAETGEMKWSHWLGDPLLSMPTVADGRVFTVYPASERTNANTLESVDPFAGDATTDSALESTLEDTDGNGFLPTHVAACFDARTGETLWRRWIDSDCMTAPVAAGADVLMTSLTGTVYRFGQSDGEIRSAMQMRATSIPVVVGEALYLTRRGDIESDEIAECIALHDQSTAPPRYISALHPAPYLDQTIQRNSDYSTDAAAFESSNGIGGGFGGGFGGGSGGNFDGGGGFFAVDDPPVSEMPPEQAEASPPLNDMQAHELADEASSDPLVRTELQAADTIGLGNVSTLQSFQGSRVLLWDDRLFNCMGDRIICTVAKSGTQVWERQLEGDLRQTGGHLGTPPIAAGGYLFVATVDGKILQIEPASGDIAKSFDVDGDVRFPPIIHQGRIYVGTQDGKIVCIDTQDKTLTGWPMWGGDPARSNIVHDPGSR